MNYKELYLIDLIDADTLTTIETAFCEMTEMSAGITDPSGVAITANCHISDFCKMICHSPAGQKMCKNCIKKAAQEGAEASGSYFYHCHAGLVAFTAPIKVKDQLLGCFFGGRILTEEPDEKEALIHAREIEIDPKTYLSQLHKVPIVSQETIINAADFLYALSNILSSIGYSRFKILQSNRDLERATRSKSDFLANMNHEIRTPMNAIIGMSEMALREPLPISAHEYINQIKIAGQSLLTIVNDILDFSKIESGLVEIHETEYAPLSLIGNIVNTVTTRIGTKDVEFTVNIPPALPEILFGDNIRIDQIILNLANNAAKFTRHGQIKLSIDYNITGPEDMILTVCMEDTGIGIRKKDIGELFNAFKRINLKNTHKIEGSGLGLAITKQLLTQMDGNIHVKSEYGKGSIFTFSLPQKIIRSEPSVTIKDPKNIRSAGFIGNPYVAAQLQTDVERLGITYIPVNSVNALVNLHSYSVNYLFIEHMKFTDPVENFVRSHPEILAILLINFQTTLEYNIPNLLIVKKPLYTFNIAEIFNNELYADIKQNETKIFDFIAPSAHILIVDDNAVNQTVAVGLLEPLQMQIDTAMSAKEAIEMIARHRYDLIFMDHMMPEVDGVEATHIIRRFYTNYNNVPIIALSANAVDGVDKFFIKEGMNDFVPKPIELPFILSKLRQWLPAEKIQQISPSCINTQPAKAIQIEHLDTQASLNLLGSEKLFWEVLKDYYLIIHKKANLIADLEQREDWKNYTIEVHALKSASRQIGALQLAALAELLEKAGNEGNSSFIHKETPELLRQYLAFDDILKGYFHKEHENSPELKPLISAEDLEQFFAKLRAAFDELDMDQMEDVIRQMQQYSYPADQQDLFTQLCGAVNEIDTDSSEDIIKMWETKL